ncbi:MAG: hypothetical protein JWO87_1191 [Phycisphaerales bacterium]|jgi:hypothetical protein|nr:hypothetical protein [Phycisphaerales bacterium]MDB5299528.1 hypothetical protein [Phycisphaerales bacterium]MDB5305552.1 hypothetical protein [Phycisphaerales bacterium]
MHEWVTVAKRLRMVKTAREQFLVRSMIERTIIGPMLLDRLAADLDRFRADSGHRPLRFSQRHRPAADEN